MSELLRCQSCGGAIVYDVAKSGASCMFCGSMALVAAPPTETIPVPELLIPFAINQHSADAEYRKWARSSWWRPKALRDLSVHLQPAFLPAWRFDCHLETHWAGLIRAHTRSGKFPTAGMARLDLRHMVPASAGLGQLELMKLQPFDERTVIAWDPTTHPLPWEPPATTRVGARGEAYRIMANHHAIQIRRQGNLVKCKVSPVVTERDVRLLMLPIYIGAFRWKDRPWRFLVNAQTGEVVGAAPVDYRKITLIVLAIIGGLFLFGLLAALLACVPPPTAEVVEEGRVGEREAEPAVTSEPEPEPEPEPKPAARGSADKNGPQFLTADAEGKVAAYVVTQSEALKKEGRTALVYVGAPWCEPCRRFHDAAVAGEFDEDLAGVTLLEFNADRDMDQLKEAGYTFRYVPLFVVPEDNGQASPFRVEGSVKGPTAVDRLRPRLQQMLSTARDAG